MRGAQANIPIKPDPTGALAISEAFNIAPEDFLYLGDTNTDMETAAAAGMFAVGVLWGFRQAEELRLSGAQLLLEQPADLLNYL